MRKVKTIDELECDFDEGKRLVANIKKSAHWHHDIQFIDGNFVELTVIRYQQTKDEELLRKILDNYAIFKMDWAYHFAPYLDTNIDDGMQMHDKIIWKSAMKFDRSKSRKRDGRAFNAYAVSALLNQLKNLRNAKRSNKNHPRIKCMACGEEVFQVDDKHLSHRIDFDRYRRDYPKHPLVSTDGLIPSPVNGKPIRELTDSHVMKVCDPNYYTVDDFKAEFGSILPKYPVNCVVTGAPLHKVTLAYPGILAEGYTEQHIVSEYPNWEGVFVCPFTNQKIIEMTQDRLDAAKKQRKPEVGLAALMKQMKNLTLSARQVPVKNPYTGKMVPEITLEMLAAAGTTLKEHLEKYATIWLGKSYAKLIYCPFTGRKTHRMQKKDLELLGRTVQQFYQATCEYPLRKFQVKCAHCGEWVNNIWEHLEAVPHQYSQPMRLEEYKMKYGAASVKSHVSTNSYVENDSGDVVHIADLIGGIENKVDPLEVEDSLLEVSKDAMDKRIAKSMRGCCTLDDVCFAAADKVKVRLPEGLAEPFSKSARAVAERQIKHKDFDLVFIPKPGAEMVEVMIPSKGTIRNRLERMVKDSDLGKTG